VKSTVLEYLSEGKPGNRLLRSGILADIRVTADGRTNSLVVTAPEESMPLMEELIKQLDRRTSTVAEIKVFLVAEQRCQIDGRADAATVRDRCQSAKHSRPVGHPGRGADDASSGLVPLKFSVDARTNSIVAVGAAESLRVVEAS